ncbi:hypothetical protein L1286_23885, partial [Pseudoalteromonas sp. SMS1]|uniref:hypothetical protein n=1 Tax=Pseudoalteromonas sp. SMS1 TaxID=2908894 RepID=UPI001F3A9BFD
GNVAASALTSYVGSELGIGDPDMLAGGMTSGDIIADTLGGIANSGLRYGSDKLLGNETSWNFKHVARDSFGNALGNAVAHGILSSNTQNKVKNILQKSRNQVTSQGAASLEQRQTVEEALSQLTPEQRKRVLISETDSNVKLSIEGETGSLNFLKGVTEGSNLKSQHESLLGFMESNNLYHDKRLLNMSAGFYSGRSAYFSSENVAHRSEAAFARGVARGEYAYEQGYAARMAMPGQMNFDLDAALAGNNAMWGNGKLRARAARETYHRMNNGWRGYEQENPTLAQTTSRQALPQTITGLALDGSAALTGALKGQVNVGNISYSEPYRGERFTHIHNPNPSHTVPALGRQGPTSWKAVPWNASTSLKLAHGVGAFAQSAKSGGVIGSVMAPIGTILQYTMDGDPMNSMKFVTDMANNTSKGIISGAVAGVAGAATTAFVLGAVATAPAWVPIAAGIGAGLAVGTAVSSGYDWAIEGLRSGAESFVNYGVENWGW